MSGPGTLRVAILGAFTFPAPRGSQAYAREQAEALQRAGADVTFVSYGGDANPREVPFTLRTIAPPLRPRASGRGPHLARPVADFALALRLRNLHRKRPFDVVLAHDAEAALVARLAHKIGGPPVVYVAHTLLEQELSATVRGLDETRLADIGSRIDRAAARSGLGMLALHDDTATRLSMHSDVPIEVQPPGVAVQRPASNGELDRVCTAHALVPGEYLLYTGNFDAVQELPVLDAIAAELPEMPVVVATHDTPAKTLEYTRVHAVPRAEIRPLLQGARLFLTPRRRAGGFPVKLANAMEAGCPILAREGQAGTLAHEHNAFLVSPDAKPDDFVVAARKLLDAPAFGRALGMQARNTAQLYHDWDVIANQTLRFVDDLLTRAR